MSQVNLDAIIKREDLYKESDPPLPMDKDEFPILRLDADLQPSTSTFKTLRKADFQRETSEWKPDRIYGLVRSFVNKDIIPAVILWNWQGRNFIIDGGHRLSAIVSWIIDDYGDGPISKVYFGEENISSEQKKLADKTRNLFKNSKEIKPFASYKYAFDNPDKVTPEEFQIASTILVNRSIQVQWIDAKTSKDAEKSFFRINGEATPISETESLILKSREKPNAMAARAIIHSGSAHKYWKRFDSQVQARIEKIAQKINNLLFDPEYSPEEVHFPIAGKGYSTQSTELVFGLVNIINGLSELNSNRKTWLKKESHEIKPDKDETGETTILYLEKVERVANIIIGKDAISLGLSPVIYFYNKKGRFQITSFLAMIHLMIEWDLDRKNRGGDKFQEFCSIRDRFEDFLLNHKYFVTEATLNIGSGIKSFDQLSSLYSFIIDSLLENKDESEILNDILNNDKFHFVRKVKSDNDFENIRQKPGKKIAPETKAEVIIRTYLENKISCPICGGHATFQSYNIDHIKALRDGGLSPANNLQLTHPYCNEERERITELKKKLKATV